MKHVLPLALALTFATLAAPAALAAPPAASITVNCGAQAETVGGEVPNLHGNWDFVIDFGGTPNFGLLSIGFHGNVYGGSLSLWMTAPVVLREINVAGNQFRAVIASDRGDVLFQGTLSARGDRMCGTVTYHDGRSFTALAQKRPSTYQSTPQSQRTPAQ